MTCNETLPLVEAIAAGDLEVDAALRAHFESCPRCSAAFASASRLEAALRARPAPPAPAQFAPMVLARVRRDRWQSEQRVDRIFNIAIIVAVLLVAVGIVALTNVSTVLAAAASVWGLASQTSGRIAQQAAPTLLSYAAAGALLASTLVMWWWAERRFSL